MTTDKRPRKTTARWSNFVNHKIGSLKVVERIDGDKNGQRRYKCVCDCDSILIKTGPDLKRMKDYKCRCLVNYYNQHKQLVINVYKKGAIERNLCFDLTEDHCTQLFKTNCFYCNIAPSNWYSNKVITSANYEENKFYYNGIDRKDNNLGYTVENCVSCCTICNKAKGSLSVNEFYDWILKISNFRGSVK